MYSIIVIIALIFFVILLFKECNNEKEYYGGPIKNIRRIPRTTCYDNCSQYYKQCMAQFGNIDAGLCSNRYWNCISTCNYSDFHRL